MNLKKLYIFLIGSLLSMLLLLKDSAFVPMQKSYSATQTSIIEVSSEKDKDFKFLTTDVKLSTDDSVLNSHLYLNMFTSCSYRSQLFRPPIFV